MISVWVFFLPLDKILAALGSTITKTTAIPEIKSYDLGFFASFGDLESVN